MMRLPRMNIMRGSLVLASLLLVLACGRNETMASKSAAAYREAQAKGIPVTGGHEHGGHEAEGADDASATTGMDHSTMTGMDHSTMTAMDHSTMGGMDHSKMTAADHSNMAGMDHSTMQHSGAQPGTMPGGMNHAAMPGMQHGGSSAPVAVVTGAPRSNAEMKGVEPAATLHTDDFDAPAASAVAEAQKAVAGGGGHEGHGVPPAATTNPHAGHGDASGTSQQTIYTCPMHPEVTSNKPGTCPKCGMTLVVKKEK